VQTPTMHHVFSRVGRLLLDAVLRGGPLLAFDFDGTLAPIVADPAAAELPEKTTSLLWRLALRAPCVVVSGRARSDVLARLKGLPLVEVIGNHGSEPWIDPALLVVDVRRWVPVLDERLCSLSGVFIEDKGCSLSIHYRHAQAPYQALRTILEVVATLEVGRVVHGKYVLNLLPALALDKGSGLRRAMDAFQRPCALYVGDDETDEDVFRLPVKAGVLGIRIGHQKDSRASLYLYRQAQIDDMLTYLLAALS